MSASALLVYGLGDCDAKDTPIHEVGLLFLAGDLKQFKEFSSFSLFLVDLRSFTVTVDLANVGSAGAVALCVRAIQQVSF